MTLRQKFDNVEIMFENQIGSLKYDELSEASNHCETIAEDFAIGFAEWFLHLFKTNQWETFSSNTNEKLLEIYKQEKDL